MFLKTKQKLYFGALHFIFFPSCFVQISAECFWNHAANQRRSQLEGSSPEAALSEEWTGSGKTKMEAMGGEGRCVPLREGNADFLNVLLD